MKIEIDIPDEAIEDKMRVEVRKVIDSAVAGWAVKNYMEEQIKARWKAVADQMITAALQDEPRMRAALAEALNKRIALDLAAAMKLSRKASPELFEAQP